MRILVIANTEKMKDGVIKYLSENIDPGMIDKILAVPSFRIVTKEDNDYRVWHDPSEELMCGTTVDLLYLDSSLPLSCLNRYEYLVVDANILKIRLIDKPEDIKIMED